ncbi:hypothetical protein LAZ67_15000691 [Cordylochernes scorpioides]|uniref:Transposase n=1 Tax=Cordylochernes scorpioides TaxID=51811 RepID=A0ABY6L885_9ARAC|nr:hypothetical protein LAZ67_15000691 [Cordylochernes scorpioides]
MNSDLYCDILVNKLKPGIRNKRRGKLSKGVLFLHDNARPHTSCKTVSTIIKLVFEVLEHPAYSPDLAPSDYFLFGLLKKELKGKRFDSDEDVQKVVQDIFHTLPKRAYKEGIYKLPERWRRCIESQGVAIYDTCGRKDVAQRQIHRLLSTVAGAKCTGPPVIDDPRQERQNVQKITDLIKENPRTTLLELEQDTGISKTTIGRIVTKDLKLKKTPAKFIPRFLTNQQKLCRLATCENMLEMTRTDPEWKDKIITGDETWVYDPETKRQYAEWRGQGELRPKKSRILKSRNKVLLVAFLDNKGIVHHEYLPAGQTVIKEMYLDILRHLREAIRKKNARKMA